MTTKLKKHYWTIQCIHGSVATDSEGLPKLFSTKKKAAERLRNNKELFEDCTYQPARLYVSDGVIE